MTLRIFDETPDEAYDKLSRIYGFTFLVMLGLGFASKLIYRKLIYVNRINDFGLADTLPNFFAVCGLSFLNLFYYRRYRGKTSPTSILISALSMIAYELSQLFDGGTFDVNDIVASILGGVVAYGMYVFFNKM